MFKTTATDHTIRTLVDAELDAVTGGVIDGCIPGKPPITVPPIDGTWTFKDIWAKWTIGN